MNIIKDIVGLVPFIFKAFLLLIFVFLATTPVIGYYGEIYGITLTIIIYFTLFAFLSYLYEKKYFLNRSHIFINIGIILLFAIILVIPQLFVINAIENESQNAIDAYSSLANDKFKGDNLAVCWNLTNAYSNNYKPTFHVKNSSIPARNLANWCVKPSYSPYIYFFIDDYYNHNSGYGKTALLTQTGNCGEFSQAVVYMINTTLGLPTRSLYFIGIDHEFPEVFINGSWYVFDKRYLTPRYPVKSDNYAEYIEKSNQRVSHCVADIKQVQSNISLLEEHGFNTTTIEVQLSNWDNISFDDAVLTLYIMDNNSTKPLIEEKKPDREGHFNFSVRSEIRYLIFAEKSNILSKYIGFNDVIANNQTEVLRIELYRIS